MSSDARLKGTAIEVSVTNGVVLMQGTAPNRASKQRALTIARQADGAVQVVDRITAGSSR
jgi:osmotically-inducible protein OsmY